MADLSHASQAALHRIVAERQSAHRVPGILGAVIRDGGLVAQVGVGSADLDRAGEPATDGTQFLIASISKTFTAVLVMALRDEGDWISTTQSRNTCQTPRMPASRSGRC